MRLTTLASRMLIAGALLAICGHHAHAKKEDWYWGFFLGYAAPSFQSGLSSNLTAAENDSRYTSSLSLSSQIHFYWPSGEKGLIGFASGGGGTSFASADGDSTRIGMSMLTLSYLYSTGPEPGTGVTLRVGAGFGTSYESGSGLFSYTAQNYGVGARAGIGFGFAPSETTRFMIEAIYGRIFGPNDSYFTIGAGPLF